MLIICARFRFFSNTFVPETKVLVRLSRVQIQGIASRFLKIETRHYQFLRKLRIKIFWWLNIFSFRIDLLALLNSWLSTQIIQVAPQTSIWVQIKHNLILLSTNKEEQNKILPLEDIIANLASIVASLVFTITTCEIRLFKTRERQFPSIRKV